ncbi:MAG: FAD:protein FMN transferase [Solirubrobacterales bacterium]
MRARECTRSIKAFGGTVTIRTSAEASEAAIDLAEADIRLVHDTLTRFEEQSELCRLNADPRETVPVSPVLLRFAEAVRTAGEMSDGLVDATCLGAVERSGYTESLGSDREAGAPVGIVVRPATPVTLSPSAGTWRGVQVDVSASTVARPPGLRLDAGGLGKGMAADMAAAKLDHLDSYAVECLGEIRFGGNFVGQRFIQVSSPDPEAGPVASTSLQGGAVATSGVTKRSWVGPDGMGSHHLIDPRTGTPADSGVIQATALAPTGLEAEILAKSALIAGPGHTMDKLPHGGVIVFDDLRVRASDGFDVTGRRT